MAAGLLAAWARITAATPGAHFAFIRPEAGSRVFRRNVESVFAARGVSADRIDWHVTRGGHMAAYEEIDISLDTFPLTGGTTTVESLLMGVPVVSLAGEAVFERLSRSILINAGLGDLCTTSIADYEACALRLAGANHGLQAGEVDGLQQVWAVLEGWGRTPQRGLCASVTFR